MFSEIRQCCLHWLPLQWQLYLLLSIWLFSLFSFTKNGFARNNVVSIIGLVAFECVGIVSASAGVTLGVGFYVSAVLMIVTDVLHAAVSKKLKAE